MQNSRWGVTRAEDHPSWVMKAIAGLYPGPIAPTGCDATATSLYFPPMSTWIMRISFYRVHCRKGPVLGPQQVLHLTKISVNRGCSKDPIRKAPSLWNKTAPLKGKSKIAEVHIDLSESCKSKSNSKPYNPANQSLCLSIRKFYSRLWTPNVHSILENLPSAQADDSMSF